MREFAINRRTAPVIYIGVISIRCEVEGEVFLDSGSSEVVEKLVAMLRFDQFGLFDRLVNARELRRDSGAVRERQFHASDATV